MPELPEAETVRAQLAPQLLGQTIIQSWVRFPRLTFPSSAEEFSARTQNQTIVEARRRGKQIYFPLGNGDHLLVHLGMTGHLQVVPRAPRVEAVSKHVHAVLKFSNGGALIFTDPRTFGKLGVSRDLLFLEKMGPEPLDDDFPVEVIVQKLSRKNTKIKAAILDQSLIAGLGNIYADEVCFLAGIHPEQRASTVPTEALRALVNFMRPTLERAIRARGATLKDGGYQDTFGQFGDFIPQVYGRTGQACDECGTTIKRGVLGASKTARSFHFCENCQPLKLGGE